MPKKFKFLFLYIFEGFLFSGLIISMCSSAYGLSISELKFLIEKQNLEVKIAEQDKKIAESEVSMARSEYFPKVSLNGTYRLLNDDISIDPEARTFNLPISDSPITLDPPKYIIKDRRSSNAHLQLVQPLWTNNRITAGLKASKAGANIETQRQQLVAGEELKKALVRYFQTVAANQIVQALENMELNLGNIRKIAGSLVSTGVTPKFSLLQVESKQSQLNAKLMEARGKAKLAKLALFSILSSAESGLESTLKTLPLPKEADQLVKTALQGRKELNIVEKKLEQIESFKANATGKMLPTFYAFGKYELIPEELTKLEPEWVVGVGLKFPLTASIKQFPERKKAKELNQKVLLIQQKAKRDIPLQVRALLSETESLSSSLASRKKSVELSREALRLVQVRFQNGKSSAMEILQAQTDLEQKAIALIRSRENYNRNLISLFHAVGNVENYIDYYQNN